MRKSLLGLSCLIFIAATAQAEIRCLDAVGEAAVVNNDLPSAKAEGIARAKWAAVEEAVGVEIKAQSIVQNMQMIDEAVSRKVKGVITSHKLLDVANSDSVVTVKLNVCVESTKANEALAGLALNNSIAVFVPARKPKEMSESEEAVHEEFNIVSETLIAKLTEQGYTVVDVAPTNAMDASEIENAMKSGNFLSLRSKMYKFLSNILLIGSIDYTVSTRKGEDAGYGISMPFNNVTVRMTYRLISRDSSGKMVILTAGTEQGKGIAGNVEDATASGLNDLAAKLSPVILDEMQKYIKSVARKIDIRVGGITGLSDNFALKEAIQNTAWVADVEDKGVGEFIVSYPENPVYLANSLEQKGIFRVEKFTPYAIELMYLKQPESP